MDTEIVKIFHTDNAENRLKLIRFFLNFQNQFFTLQDLEKEIKIKDIFLKKEVASLLSSKFLEKSLEKKVLSYRFNPEYNHKDTLTDFVFDFKNINRDAIFEKFQNIGRIKLFIFSGFFVENLEVEIDILIVCDILKEKEIQKVLQEIKINYGQKLRVIIMDLEDFEYRYKMFDRFIQLVIDTEKIVYLNKTNILV